MNLSFVFPVLPIHIEANPKNFQEWKDQVEEDINWELDQDLVYEWGTDVTNKHVTIKVSEIKTSEDAKMIMYALHTLYGGVAIF